MEARGYRAASAWVPRPPAFLFPPTSAFLLQRQLDGAFAIDAWGGSTLSVAVRGTTGGNCKSVTCCLPNTCIVTCAEELEGHVYPYGLDAGPEGSSEAAAMVSCFQPDRETAAKAAAEGTA